MSLPHRSKCLREGGKVHDMGQSSWHTLHALWCWKGPLETHAQSGVHTHENNYLSHTPYGIWTKSSAAFYEQLLHETELLQVCRLWYTESMVFMTWLRWVACWGPEERIPVLRLQCWSMHLTGMALEFHTWKKTVTLIKYYAELMHGSFCQEIQVFFPFKFLFLHCALWEIWITLTG